MEVLVVASFGVKTLAGLELNNYMHIKQNANDPWRGSLLEDGKLVVDEHNHAAFVHPIYGLRSGIRVISSYVVKHELNTLSGIVRRFTSIKQDWMPYEEFLGRKLSWDINKPLRCFDKVGKIIGPAQLEQLVRAMCEYELFRGFVVPDAEIESAINLYNAHFEPRG